MRRKRVRPGDVVSHTYLIILSIIVVFPLLWLLVSAFKGSSEMLNNPTRIWPIHWTLENFKTVLIDLHFTVNIRNSLIIAFSTTIIAIVISCLAAYGIIRFFPKFGNAMTRVLVTTYMFPSIMLVIPYAMVMARLNLTNTRIGLVLVYLSFSVPYAVWMLVGFSIFALQAKALLIIVPLFWILGNLDVSRLKLILFFIFSQIIIGFCINYIEERV